MTNNEFLFCPRSKTDRRRGLYLCFPDVGKLQHHVLQAGDEDLPTFRAPFNQFFHMRQLLEPEFTQVVASNNDTLYSPAWLDLSAGPVVLGLPDSPDERYYMIQIVDMDTFNVEYIGARTTGYQTAKYLFAGPG